MDEALKLVAQTKDEASKCELLSKEAFDAWQASKVNCESANRKRRDAWTARSNALVNFGVMSTEFAGAKLEAKKATDEHTMLLAEESVLMDRWLDSTHDAMEAWDLRDAAHDDYRAACEAYFAASLNEIMAPSAVLSSPSASEEPAEDAGEET